MTSRLFYHKETGAPVQIIARAQTKPTYQEVICYQELTKPYDHFVMEKRQFFAEYVKEFAELPLVGRKQIEKREDLPNKQPRISKGEIMDGGPAEAEKPKEAKEPEVPEAIQKMLAFLDAESCHEKIRILEEMQDDLTEHILNNIAVSLDLSLEDDEDGFERIMAELRMREKYESLSAFVLKDLAKARGIKGVSSLKKGQIIEKMLEEDAKEAEEAEKNGTAEERANSFKDDYAALDSGEEAEGILEVMPEGFGFIRCDNYMPGDHDIYVAPAQIRRFNLKTGDIVKGNMKVKSEREKFQALLYLTTVNGYTPDVAQKRTSFEDLVPIFPNERLRLERPGASVAMRVVDLISPIGKGQRGMIVSQPKAGKTTLLKEVAKSVTVNNPEMHLIILLIDERPEEVTDIKEAIEGDNVEVIYSTFDELPEHHKRVSEMVIERAKRLVEHGNDVMILLDSITRLARAYNVTVPPSGRTLSGGLDPVALHMPKRFFGAARNMRNGGSLTILATALVDTGSKMDDVVFEEFKGTGNMELVLDRKLSEKRIFPAIDIVKSGTRREDLLLDEDEQAAVDNMRKAFNGMRSDEAVENVLNMFAHTKSNKEFVNLVKKNRIL
mgnify:CR=1 FL=1